MPTSLTSLPGVAQVVRFDSLDSTNTRARSLAAPPAGEVTVVVARRQTGGRGQRGNSFHSSHDGGLWVTLVVTLDDMDDHVRVNQALALSACDAAQDCADVRCTVKWPNDIMVGERKLGGILLETTGHPGGIAAGIGLNVNMPVSQYPEELRGIATSLVDQCGHATDLEDLLCALVAAFMARVAMDSERRRADYRAALQGVGRQVRIQDCTGEFMGVSDQGLARVRCDTGEKQFYSGPMRFIKSQEER